MKTPRFSIVVPVYNAAASLAATVASVLAQTEPSFELLLIDDGSTDDSRQVMHALAAEDARIRVYTQANAGVAATRNRGAALARGSLIAFLDADDFWHAEKLALHAQLHAECAEIGCSYAQIAFIESDEGALEQARTRSSVPSQPLRLEQVLGENPVCTSSNIVVSRECFQAVGGFRDGMQYAEDQEWLARVISRGYLLVGIDRLLVGYRLSPNGLSTNLEAMYAGWRMLAAMYREQFDAAAAEALYCRYLARRALRSGAAPIHALRFTWAGLVRDAGTFLSDRRRGGLTLLGALASPFMPASARIRLFA